MNKNQGNQAEKDIKYQISGWVLFIMCAILFIASSLKNHDTLTFIGSVLFLIACVSFLVPVLNAYKINGEDTKLKDDRPTGSSRQKKLT